MSEFRLASVHGKSEKDWLSSSAWSERERPVDAANRSDSSSWRGRIESWALAHPFAKVSTLKPTVGVVAMGADDCILAIFSRLMIVVFPLLSSPTTSTDT